METNRIKTLFTKLVNLSLILVIALSMFSTPISTYADGDCGWFSINCNDKKSFREYTDENPLEKPKAEDYQELAKIDNVREFIITVVNYALSFLGLAAVIVIIFAGFQLVVGGGTDKVDTSKKMITYAIVGLLIVLSSFAVVNTVLNSTGDGSDEGGPNSGNEASYIGYQSSNSAEAYVKKMLARLKTLGNELAGVYEGYSGLHDLVENSYATLENINHSNGKASLENIKSELLKAKNGLYKYSTIPVHIDRVVGEIDKQIKVGSDSPGTIYDWEYALSEIKDEIERCKVGVDSILLNCEVSESVKNAYQRVISGGSDCDTSSKISECRDELKGINIDKVYLKDIKTELNALYNEAIVHSYNKATARFAVELVKTSAFAENMSNINDMLRLIVSRLWQESDTEISDEVMAIAVIVDVLSQDAAITRSLVDRINDFAAYDSDSGIKASQNPDDSKFKINKVTGEKIGETLGLISDLITKLEELQFVNAVIETDKVSGNASLNVAINGLRSVDPMGETIQEDMYTWYVSPVDNSEKGYECISLSNSSVIAGIDEGFVKAGPNLSCEFTKSGAYMIHLKALSSNPEIYADGIAQTKVIVKPPTSSFYMDLHTESSQDPISLISPEYQESTVILGISEVEGDGIYELSVEDTVGYDGTANSIESITYQIDGINSTPIDLGGVDGKIPLQWKGTGKYKGIFEVKSNNGEVDRTIVDFHIRGIVSRVYPNRLNSYIESGEEIALSGYQSVSTNMIQNYDWKLFSKVDENGNASKNGNRSTSPVAVGTEEDFVHTFTDAGHYEVELTVSDMVGEMAATPIQVGVNSIVPMPNVTIKQSRKTHTSLYDVEVNIVDPDEKGDPSVMININNKEYGIDKDYVYYIEGELQTANQFSEPVNLAQLDNLEIVFNKVGEYKLDFEIIGTNGKELGDYEQVVKTVNIDNVMSIDFAESTESQNQRVILLEENTENNTLEAKTNLVVSGHNIVACEFYLGDNPSVEIVATESESVMECVYEPTFNKAGVYNLKVEGFDKDDNELTINKTLFVGAANTNIAIPVITIDGQEIYDISKEVEIYKNSKLKLDASYSINKKGHTRKTKAIWSLDGEQISKEKVLERGLNKDSELELKIIFENEESEPVLIKFKIINEVPKLNTLKVTPKGDMVIPASFDLEAIGAADVDGEISQYKWFARNKETGEKIGTKITGDTPVTSLIIDYNTSETNGKNIVYEFGVELKDDSGNTAEFMSSSLENGEIIPTEIEVEHTMWPIPVVAINMSKSAVMMGEEIELNAQSENAKWFKWELIDENKSEGDSAQSNVVQEDFNQKYGEWMERIDGASIKYDFKRAYPDGAKIKVSVSEGALKPEENSLIGEHTIKVFVDLDESKIEPPKAAFTYEVIDISDGITVEFTNNSQADNSLASNKIEKYTIDFNHKVDADGDGNPTNDLELARLIEYGEKFTHKYNSYDSFNMNVVVTDSYDKQTVGERKVIVKAIDLKPAFKPNLSGVTQDSNTGRLSVNLFNLSNSDIPGIKYEWDCDITEDSNFDGDLVDIDSVEFNALCTYEEYGEYPVSLTMKDPNGGSEKLVRTIQLLDIDLSAIKDPKAAFVFEVIEETSDGYKVKVINNSTVDSSLAPNKVEEYIFDTNINEDSDGDGVKDNDTDIVKTIGDNFTINLKEGTHNFILKIKDSYGKTDTVTNGIILKKNKEFKVEAAFIAATQSLTRDSNGKIRVQFKSNTTSENGTPNLKWDSDTTFDSSGNGILDDDEDSTISTPVFMYDDFIEQSVKLTATDALGNTDSVTKKITLTEKKVGAITPAFVWEEDIHKNEDGTVDVTFINKTESLSTIKAIAWDFDADEDFNGDGKNDNDNQAGKNKVKHTYDQVGVYSIVLLVQDIEGKIERIKRKIDLSDYIAEEEELHAAPQEAVVEPIATSPKVEESGDTFFLSTVPAYNQDNAIKFKKTSTKLKLEVDHSLSKIRYKYVKYRVYSGGKLILNHTRYNEDPFRLIVDVMKLAGSQAELHVSAYDFAKPANIDKVKLKLVYEGKPLTKQLEDNITNKNMDSAMLVFILMLCSAILYLNYKFQLEDEMSNK